MVVVYLPNLSVSGRDALVEACEIGAGISSDSDLEHAVSDAFRDLLWAAAGTRDGVVATRLVALRDACQNRLDDLFRGTAERLEEGVREGPASAADPVNEPRQGRRRGTGHGRPTGAGDLGATIERDAGTLSADEIDRLDAAIRDALTRLDRLSKSTE